MKKTPFRNVPPDHLIVVMEDGMVMVSTMVTELSEDGNGQVVATSRLGGKRKFLSAETLVVDLGRAITSARRDPLGLGV